MSADIAYGIPPRVVQSRKRAIDSSFLAEGQISFQEERAKRNNKMDKTIGRRVSRESSREEPIYVYVERTVRGTANNLDVTRGLSADFLRVALSSN